MPKKSRPIETFGAFAIHRDGTVTTTSGQRPSDLIASGLHGTRQSVDDDMAAISAFVRDYERALTRARTYAARVADFRPLPLAMCYPVSFEGQGVGA